MIAIDRPSHRTALVLGLALLALVNVVALAGVYWNRGAEDSRLRLGERELGLPYSYQVEDGEDPGVSLRLNWRSEVDCSVDWPCGNFDYGDTAWLDAAKLATLGFDVRPMPEPVGEQRDPRAQERQAYVVLEFAGPAYVRYLQQREANLRAAQAVAAHAGRPGDPVAEAAREARGEAGAVEASIQAARNGVVEAAEQLRQAAREDSRLFAIDAGLDREALRRRYPDRQRHAIVEALLGYSPRWEKGDFRARGRVNSLLVEAINLPRPMAKQLGLARGSYADPQSLVHFEGTIAFGRRLEPWVLDVRRNDAPR